MTREPAAKRTALQYELEVQDDGRIQFDVPLKAGTRVIVFVIEEGESGFDDLLAASQTSLDFWDNPFDDEDWNNA